MSGRKTSIGEPTPDALCVPPRGGDDPAPSRRQRPPATLLVGAGAVSVQVGAALATHLFSRVGPAGATTLRLILAAAALVAISARHLRRLRTASRADLFAALGFGVALGGMNLSFYEALARVPLGVAVTVEFAGPLAVTIAGSRRRSDFVWAVLAGGGVFLLAGGGLFGGRHHLDDVGILLALVAACCWAGYIYLNAEAGKRFGGTSGLALAMVVAAVLVLPFGVTSAGGHLLEPAAIGLGCVVAVLSSVVPYSFELIALRRVSTRAFGILLSIDPGIAALAGLVILGQRLDATEIAALLLVVAANAGSSWFDAKAAPLPY